jgi:hypothetical protein
VGWRARSGQWRSWDVHFWMPSDRHRPAPACRATLQPPGLSDSRAWLDWTVAKAVFRERRGQVMRREGGM